MKVVGCALFSDALELAAEEERKARKSKKGARK